MVRRRQGRRAPRARKPAILLGVVMGVWLSAPAFAETAQVRAIRVSEAGGDTAVVISASARPTFTTWKLEQPARVVVDLSGVRLGNVEVPMDAGTYAVGLVSANVSEDEGGGSRTRIVLTLRQASDYRVEARGNDIVVRVIPHLRPAASKVAAPDPGEAEAKAQAQAKAEHAQAQAKAEQAKAQAKAEQAEAQAKAERAKAERAEAQAKADKAEAQAKADRAEARAKADKAEAQAKADKAEARAKADKAEAQAKADKAEAQAKADKAEAQAKADKAEAQAKTDKAEAQAKADKAEAQAKTDKAEAQAKADKAEAQAKADKAEAQAKADKAEARAKTEAQAKAEAQLKAEAQSQAAAQANAENAKLKLQLQQARRDAQNAQAMASAASAEAERQKAAVARADEHARTAEREADQAIRRAKLAERETLTAQQRETERDRALQKAAREVEMRTAALEAKAKHQDEQRQRLLEAEGLVAEQKAKLRVAATELAEREQASRAAQAKRQRLEHTGASSPDKALAAAAVAKAEEERKNAADAAERSRKELTLAVATRRAEEARRQEEMRGRRDEEEKLKQAESARAAEETRLAQARTDRARVENERAKLEQERAQLEAARDALAAEVKRLAQASAPAKLAATAPAPVALPIPTPAKPVAKEEKTIVASAPPAPDSAKPVTRPRSITLRVPSRIRRIDFVDEPSRSSVIIDLEEPSGFTVERSANRRVSLRLDHADLPDELVRSLDATEYLGPVRLISSYQDPHARGTVRVDVDLAEDVPNRVRQDGNRIYWDFQKATPANGQKLPALGGPLPPSVLFVPARRVAGYSVTFPTAVTLAQAQPQTQAQSTARKSGEDESPTTKRANLTGKKRYTGRRIDLDFKGADIHNILRLLADVGQMNIVTSDEVKGEVTIKMRDVPWDQALDVVLRAKGLGSVREGNLVRVAPLSVLEKELEQEIARQKQIAEVLPTETRLIGVSYAHASSLQDKARDLLSPRGKISVDDRTNNLIVSDVARNLQLIEDLVRNLDTQTSQVVIEARIVEANTDYARQIGIQWGGNTFMDASHGNPTGLVFPYNVGIGGGADDGSSPLSGLVPGARTGVAGGANPNFVVNMPAPAGLATGSAIGLTMGSVAGAFNLNLRLSAMESTGTVRILSSPRITTMDNIDATIEQGVSIPVSVVSAMGAMTQFVDAKLHLGVKPHVTNEGTVMLTVTVTKNEPDFVNTGARGDPTILKKEAKTTMLVRDGDTAVIGGIYTRNAGLSFTKVPFFSDIPVLGWFFRNRKENDNRTEFLVFLTPRIVNRARALGQ
jgi:type IV pilus assembly protein PilQ